MPNIFEKDCDKCGAHYRSWNKRFCRKCASGYSPPNDKKWCSACNQYKIFDSFAIWARGEKGLRNQCRECREINRKVYYLRKRQNGNSYFSYQGIKKRFHTNEDIGKEAYVNWYNSTPKICKYCDIPEETWLHINNKFKYWGTKNSRLSVDRMDNDFGYTAWNICLCCQLCNAVKNSFFNSNEFLEISQKYIKPKWQKLINDKTIEVAI